MKFWKDVKSHTRLYADAAAATPLSKNSRDELIRLLDLYGNAGALHQEGVAAKTELEKARKMIAESIGAHADEIIFTASGTEGNNLGIHGVLRPLLQKHGKLGAITCAIEHQSVLEPLRALKREGLTVTELPVDSEGLVSPKQLAEAITDTTVFVSIQLVNSEVGTIEPLREIAKEIRRVRQSRSPLRSPSEAFTAQTSALPLFLHTDASQAPLWLKVGVEQLGVDLMTLDGQKVLGPKGVGALYVRRGVPIESIFWGGAQERGLRGGTPNVPQNGAFAVALHDAQQGVEERAQKVSIVRDFCIEEIRKLIPDVIVNGPTIENRVANNLNISVPGLDAEMAVIALDARGVAASTRSACNIGDEDPSHAIKALGTPRALSKTAIRITFLPDITRAQVRMLAEALAEVAAKYRTLEKIDRVPANIL
jgi:cysteine desulfurase